MKYNQLCVGIDDHWNIFYNDRFRKPTINKKKLTSKTESIIEQSKEAKIFEQITLFNMLSK